MPAGRGFVQPGLSCVAPEVAASTVMRDPAQPSRIREILAHDSGIIPPGHGFDAGVHFCFAGDIHLEADDAVLLAKRGGSVRCVSQIEIGDCHAAAGFHEALGYSESDASRRAGDQRDFVVEFHDAFSIN